MGDFEWLIALKKVNHIAKKAVEEFDGLISQDMPAEFRSNYFMALVTSLISEMRIAQDKLEEEFND